MEDKEKINTKIKELSEERRHANYNDYLNPCELLKMATTNACLFDFDKSCIEVGQASQFNVIKHFSKNPYLSIINRSQTKNILYTINKNIK